VKRRLLIALAAVFLATGCATTRPTHGPVGSDGSPWRGRLAVQIEADPNASEPQSFSAAFELSGSAPDGALTLFTPIGTTAAALSWTPSTAVLKTNGETQRFASLDALIKQVIGTEIPVAALFAWLAGENMNAAGWSADLSRQTDGRITARRLTPAPAAELRLVLDQ
jgi:outer membrane lipoprotein LolB